jgi:hypothetical protein
MEDLQSQRRRCAHCAELFSPTVRAGRNTGRAKAGRKRTYHLDQRFCSARCQSASAKRRARRLFRSAIGADGALPGTIPLSPQDTASGSPQDRGSES